jgi:hypothetical protein
VAFKNGIPDEMKAAGIKNGERAPSIFNHSTHERFPLTEYWVRKIIPDEP